MAREIRENKTLAKINSCIQYAVPANVSTLQP